MLKIRSSRDFSAEDINKLQKAFDIIGGKVALIQNDNCVTVSFNEKSVKKPRIISTEYITSETTVYRPLKELDFESKKEEKVSITVELYEWYDGISDDIIKLAREEAKKYYLPINFVDITVVSHSDTSTVIVGCMPIDELFDLEADCKTNDNKVFFLSADY